MWSRSSPPVRSADQGVSKSEGSVTTGEDHFYRVSLANTHEFLRAGVFALGIGSDLMNPGTLAAYGTGCLTERARQYVQIVHDHHRQSND